MLGGSPRPCETAAVSPSSPEDRSLVERSVHDLLNPLSAVLGLAETLRSRGAELGDETIRSFGGSIVRQAARMEDAIRDLAQASRLIRGSPEIARRDVSAREVLQPFASSRVDVDVQAGLRLSVDPVVIAGAIERLVDNATGFSSGPVAIAAGGGGATGTVWIEIADHGPGFEPGALEDAFEPLAPGTNARNERGSGLGLGLFIARRLVETHRGRLTARSAPGEGSVFRIELPA